MFDALSWEPWRAFLEALQALPMSAEHLDRYRHHTGRFEPPTKPARYAELVVGRRGGKSRILALIATYLACVIDHRDHIVPGETPVVAIIAKDRTQARVILSYIVGFMREIPLFAELIEDELAETIRLSNGVVVEVHTASIGAPRGTDLPGRFLRRDGLLANWAIAPIRMSRSSTPFGRACQRSLTRCSSSPPRPMPNEASSTRTIRGTSARTMHQS